VKKEKDKEWADYYDEVNILDELLEEPVEFSLGERLRRDILSKKRKRRLQNITVTIRRKFPLREAPPCGRGALLAGDFAIVRDQGKRSS
jgi:hypothetical protein